MGEIHSDVHVLREGAWHPIDSRNLVPGDVIQVTEGVTCPVDSMVTSGTVIADEAMLTGKWNGRHCEQAHVADHKYRSVVKLFIGKID